MFVKLIVLACALALTNAAWNGPLAGGQPADRYPAGISPQACPNYPHCNNPAVAVNAAAPSNGWGGAQQQWNGAGHNQWDQGNQWNGGGQDQWNGGGQNQWNDGSQNQWNDGSQNQWNGDDQNQWNDGNKWNNGGNDWNQNSLDRGDYTGDGDYRGEGLSESGAYGGSDGSQGYANQGNGGYGGHGGAAQVPAGVDPSSCPNYPFCH